MLPLNHQLMVSIFIWQRLVISQATGIFSTTYKKFLQYTVNLILFILNLAVVPLIMLANISVPVSIIHQQNEQVDKQHQIVVKNC